MKYFKFNNTIFTLENIVGISTSEYTYTDEDLENGDCSEEDVDKIFYLIMIHRTNENSSMLQFDTEETRDLVYNKMIELIKPYDFDDFIKDALEDKSDDSEDHDWEGK